MFRSRTRAVVYPQAEHARVAAAIAAAWGGERPPLPFESWVRGVALHDRGYGELDADPIGETDDARWLEIERRGLADQTDDPTVELVVVMHIQRLMSYSDSPERKSAADELAVRVLALRDAAGVSAVDAAAADVLTNLCDRIAFELCFERDVEFTVGSFSCTSTADGVATIDPWPLANGRLEIPVVGYEAGGYPGTLRPVARTFAVQPA